MFNRNSMAAVIAELDCIISFITASRSPNPASVEAQTPDVGSERGSAVMGGGRR